ncbi:MAG: hypothetical protein K0S34_1051 [Bacillales bacterium]|nr:hypothetical protein [Bacillales bacterium]
MLYVPSLIALYIVPFLFMLYIYRLFKYIRRKDRQKINFLNLKSIFVILSIIFIFHITYNQSQEVSTTLVDKIQHKISEDNKYYLVINNAKVRVPYNEFLLVDLNKEYLITFLWNKKNPYSGKLNYIEPIETSK